MEDFVLAYGSGDMSPPWRGIMVASGRCGSGSRELRHHTFNQMQKVESVQVRQSRGLAESARTHTDGILPLTRPHNLTFHNLSEQCHRTFFKPPVWGWR